MPKKQNNKPKHKLVAGSGIPSMSDIQNISDLDFNKPSDVSNYNDATRNIKITNFAGGRKVKTKIKNVLKVTYVDYKQEKPSKLLNLLKQKGGGIADNALTIKVIDTYNTENLDFSKDYSYDPVTRIGKAPYSQLAYYR